MANIIPSLAAEYSSQRILTTEQLAKAYGVPSVRIRQNFNRNKDRFQIGKHYFVLEGQAKTDFLNLYQIDTGSTASTLYLWTEKGAFLHAKSLNTDQAWDVYERLVDEYYRQQAALIAYEQYTAALQAERNNRFSSPALDELHVIIHRLQREGHTSEDVQRANELMERCLESEQRVIATGRELRSKL